MKLLVQVVTKVKSLLLSKDKLEVANQLILKAPIRRGFFYALKILKQSFVVQLDGFIQCFEV